MAFARWVTGRVVSSASHPPPVVCRSVPVGGDQVFVLFAELGHKGVQRVAGQRDLLTAYGLGDDLRGQFVLGSDRRPGDLQQLLGVRVRPPVHGPAGLAVTDRRRSDRPVSDRWVADRTETGPVTGGRSLTAGSLTG